MYAHSLLSPTPIRRHAHQVGLHAQGRGIPVGGAGQAHRAAASGDIARLWNGAALGGACPWGSSPWGGSGMRRAVHREAAGLQAGGRVPCLPALYPAAGVPRRVSMGRHLRLYCRHGCAHGCGCGLCAAAARLAGTHALQRTRLAPAIAACRHAAPILLLRRSWLAPSWACELTCAACVPCPTALAVMRALEPAASEYRASLLRQAVALLLRSWGAQAALGIQAPAAVMCAVELPPFRCGGAIRLPAFSFHPSFALCALHVSALTCDHSSHAGPFLRRAARARPAARWPPPPTLRCGGTTASRCRWRAWAAACGAASRLRSTTSSQAGGSSSVLQWHVHALQVQRASVALARACGAGGQP